MTGTKKCPLCGRATEERFKPFCSKRCANLDLGRWLKGSYGIPATEQDDEDEKTEPDEKNERDA